ncbi:hypothetical protein Fleli_2118 [Bernardetia litoralis DSM 6794]|uniref:Peptidase MA-like domain-containing protein n=1 Tax=Bernardetia litoralis (strain ATCC 23117 / DSM 6794 / NBRC 15988 / NCIMB 1366 / Fx l1 / Sio-4) TaxID=880071 RepID=I4AKL5_BERLS|nr:hypothetical protein [Bernardetia litoralis]AFM04500.1 hypothetical protein Fleli_2118 [Bernardetia litoralis DSM 6794]
MKFKKHILLIYLLLVSNLAFSQKQEEKYTLENSPKFDNHRSVPPNDRNVYKAMEIWKEYISTQNDSLLLKTEYLTPEHLNIIKNQIFYSYVSKSFFHYQIIDYKKEEDTYLLDTHLYLLFPKDSTITTLSIYRVRLVPKDGTYKIKFMVEENMSKLTKKETEWIDYYYLPSQHNFSKEKAQQANNYCDSISTLFKLPKREKMQYFIFPSASDLFLFWGHINYFNPGVVMLKENQGIFITHSSEFYTHEITHYLFGKYEPNYIFSEGLASWMGNGGLNYYLSVKEYIDSIKEHDYEDVEIMEKMLRRKYYQLVSTHYTLGALIMQEAYKKGGTELVKSIMSTTREEDVIDVIREQFGLKSNEEAIKFVITLVKNYSN